MEGTGPRLLPRAYQEHLDRGPGKRSPGGGALLGAMDQGGDGAQVPRGYIEDGETEKNWLKEKIQGWTESVNILSGVALKHLQSA